MSEGYAKSIHNKSIGAAVLGAIGVAGIAAGVTLHKKHAHARKRSAAVAVRPQKHIHRVLPRALAVAGIVSMVGALLLAGGAGNEALNRARAKKSLTAARDPLAEMRAAEETAATLQFQTPPRVKADEGRVQQLREELCATQQTIARLRQHERALVTGNWS